MKRANFLVLAMALAVAVSGCKRKPAGVTPLEQQHTTVTKATPAGPVGGNNANGPGTGKTLTDDTAQAGKINNPDNTTTTGKITGSGIATADASDLNNYDRDAEAFRSQTVHFDYDRAAVKSSDRQNIEGVAAYLKNNANQKVMVEGHCDERGTEEYNRALGERRALAAREALVSNGISPDRVFTTSFGEDRPADTGHDESAWAKNRRAEFILLKPRQ